MPFQILQHALTGFRQGGRLIRCLVLEEQGAHAALENQQTARPRAGPDESSCHTSPVKEI